MKTTRLSAHHHQLTQLGLINAYFVQENDNFTLIDTCLGQEKFIRQIAEELGHPIRSIALTHSHKDHAGSVAGLLRLFPTAELSLSRREARLLAGDRTLDPLEPQLKLRGDYTQLASVPGRLLQGGDRLGSLRVIDTPGHTPGHVAFLDERDGTLFAGDAFTVAGGVAVAGDLRLLFPLPALATWSFDLAIASAEALVALAPTRLCTGHGRCLTNPLAAMKTALDRATARRQAALRSKTGHAKSYSLNA